MLLDRELDRVRFSKQYLDCINDAQANLSLDFQPHSVLPYPTLSDSQFLDVLQDYADCKIRFLEKSMVSVQDGRLPVSTLYSGDELDQTTVLAIKPQSGHPNFSFKLRQSAIVATAIHLTTEFYRDTYLGRGVSAERFAAMKKNLFHEYGHILHDIHWVPSSPVPFSEYWESLVQPVCERTVLTSISGRVASSIGVALGMTAQREPGFAKSVSLPTRDSLSRIVTIGGCEHRLDFRIKFTRGESTDMQSHINLLMDWAAKKFESQALSSRGECPEGGGVLWADTQRQFNHKADANNFGKVYWDLRKSDESLSTKDESFTVTFVKIPKTVMLSPQYAWIR